MLLGLALPLSTAGAEPTGPSQPLPQGVDVTRAGKAPEAWLFTAQSASGKTRKLKAKDREDERFMLKLVGVGPVTKFSDRPFRDASLISPRMLVGNWKKWFGASPPNAVLTFRDSARPAAAPSSIVVTLKSARYNKKADALIFTAVRIHRLHDPAEDRKDWSRTSTPRSFTSASLFIDDAYNCGPGANCRGMDISYWDLHGDYFAGADWAYVNAEWSNLEGINLQQINGFDADFTGADLEEASFYGANLAEASFLKSDAVLADFSYANLQNADLSYGNFNSADFTGANLTGANITGANFSYATFDKTVMVDMYDADTQGAIDAGSAAAEHIALEVLCAAIPAPLDLLCEAVATAVEEYQFWSGNG